jgi:uncharacterized damage-inducible protein DinB
MEDARREGMDAEYFHTLFDYQYWARDKLLAAVRYLSEADYLGPRPMDYGSIHGTLVHVYAAEEIWHSRWVGQSPARLSGAVDIPGLDELTRRWTDREQQIRGFIAGLSDEDVRTRLVDYHDTQGRPNRHLLWQMMAHVINHGTHHRSEVAAAATQLGHSPGDLDLIVYFRTASR